MDKDILTLELKKLADSFLEDKNIDLVDLVCRRQGSDIVVEILVDRPEGGITIDECSFVNREIGRLIDEKVILSEGYLLEVSSPGIDRPLSTKKDFLRHKDKIARFFLSQPLNSKLEWVGKIIRVEDDSVVVEASSVELNIPLSLINKAKQEIN